MVNDIARKLGKLSSRWLERDFPYRKKAVARLVKRSGYSKAMAEAMLDALFEELTEPKLLRLLRAELGNPRALDGFVMDPVRRCQVRAQGPRTITHIFSSNVPNPSIVSFMLGMLVKSVNIGKLSSKGEGFLDIYLESLRRHDKKLARTNFLLKPLDKKSALASIQTSDLVVAYGNSETLRHLKKEVPAGVHFVGYGHRVSFGLYTREALKKQNVDMLAEKTARDMWMADQRGCLSPLTLFLEEGGVAPFVFAEALAKKIRMFFSAKDSTAVSYERAVAHQTLINQCSVRQIKGEKVRFWQSQPRGRWLVVCDEKASVLSGGDQVIYLKPFQKMEQVFKALQPFRKYLQAVSLEAKGARRKKISDQLAKAGANRICRAGRMQHPPITWHHDGRPNLSDWVTWTDLEI